MLTYTESLSPGDDLYSKLRSYCMYGEVKTGTTLEVTLKSGNYYISNALEFQCNVIIRGNTDTFVTATNFNGWTDDGLICVKGSTDNKLKLEVYNIEFKVNATIQAPSERHYFKAYFCDKIVFDNCIIKLMNGSITNIDLRCCSNINIQNCLLENYNRSLTGGTLWIRGETNNVIISHNTFKKHGNDEVIAIWGDGDIYGTEVNSITKRNILISNNIFEYGQNNSSKYGIDKYIAFYESFTRKKDVIFQGVPQTIEVLDDRSYIWKSVLIANNTFQIYDLVRNLIHVNFAARNSDVKGFSIENNTINHYEYEVNESINSDNEIETDFERDFAILSSCSQEIYVPIRSNIINANQIVYANSNLYVNLFIDRATVDYQNNNIDATGLLNKFDSNGNKLNTKGIIVSEIVGNGGVLTMTENNISGIYLLERSANNINSQSIGPVKLNIFNNNLSGETIIYCKNLEEMNAYIYGNTFITNSYYLLFKNFGYIGSFSICDNIWQKSETNTYMSGTIYEKEVDLPEYNSSFNKIVFIGNVLSDYSSGQIINRLPNATTNIVGANIFNE